MSCSDLIQQYANLCVKCGLCLPHCPAYTATQHEGYSPRGRIALMAAFAQQQLLPTPENLAYLDPEDCLQCGACEFVCPSLVPYRKLVNETSTFLASGIAAVDPSESPYDTQK